MLWGGGSTGNIPKVNTQLGRRGVVNKFTNSPVRSEASGHTFRPECQPFHICYNMRPPFKFYFSINQKLTDFKKNQAARRTISLDCLITRKCRSEAASRTFFPRCILERRRRYSFRWGHFLATFFSFFSENFFFSSFRISVSGGFVVVSYEDFVLFLFF